MSTNGMIWCSTRSATVALIVRDGFVVDCPSYANNWARGEDARDLWRRCARHGARLVWIPDDEGTTGVAGVPAPEP